MGEAGNAIAALQARAGSWRGESSLWLGDETYVCVMTATIEPGMQGQAVLVRYDWEIEDDPQDGLLVLNELDGTVAGTWFDSWHMANSSIAMSGPGGSGETVAVTGAYPVRDSPDWSWRIELEPAGDDGLTLRMVNISPEGEETPAVQTDFVRQ